MALIFSITVWGFKNHSAQGTEWGLIRWTYDEVLQGYVLKASRGSCTLKSNFLT